MSDKKKPVNLNNPEVREVIQREVFKKFAEAVAGSIRREIRTICNGA